MNKNEIQNLLKTKKEKPSLVSTLGYFLFAVITYVCLAFGIQYVYNDYAQTMQTGWQVITAGQVYFTLVAFGIIRIWFTHNKTIIEHSKDELTLTENALATFGKLLALVFSLIMYTIIKAIVF